LEVGKAYATNDVLDQVEVALAAVDMHLAFLFAPVSSCIDCHVSPITKPDPTRTQSRVVPTIRDAEVTDVDKL
jgi:hypothetical protein